MQRIISLILATFLVATVLTEASLDYLRSQDLDLAPSHYWSNGYIEPNSTLSLGAAMGCNFCGDVFYHEPPPDDIIYIPSPPLHPSFQGAVSDIMSAAKQQTVDQDQCSFCNLFYGEGEQLSNSDEGDGNYSNRMVVVLVALTAISAVVCLYLIGSRRTRIIASLTRTTIFKSSSPTNVNHQLDKNNSLNDSIANSGLHLSDPCYLQTNRDKNLTSPIISDHAPHKKTAIPSKYWAQPGSIVNRTIRRVPNEYEVPSSQTNSTGTSSAVYADMNNEGNQRFFSPYNLHTYAEVREVMDTNEHFHTSSNSSAMLSESNYDNAVYSHNNGAGPGCVLNNASIISAPNGSVQMSDFNSMRSVQPMAYNQAPTIASSQHTMNLHMPKMHHNTSNHQQMQQAIYEQPPPHRAQVILTSNNQGVNPTLLNYRDRVHNVI